VPDPDALAALLGTPGAALPALILAEPGSPTLADALATLNRLGGDSGPIVTIHTLTPDGPLPEWLLEERLLSINTAAAGGNASLMTLS
ncbi:hypothetical protein, partial [Nguyenibacter vanlangensis]